MRKKNCNSRENVDLIRPEMVAWTGIAWDFHNDTSCMVEPCYSL